MSVRGVRASYHQSVGRGRSLRRTNHLQSKDTIQNTMRHLPRAPFHRFPSSTALPSSASHGHREIPAARAHGPHRAPDAGERHFCAARAVSLTGSRGLPGSNRSTRNRPTPASPPDGDPWGGCGWRRGPQSQPRGTFPLFPSPEFTLPSIQCADGDDILSPGRAKRQNTNRKTSPNSRCPSVHLHVGASSQCGCAGTQHLGQGSTGAMSTAATDPHARAGSSGDGIETHTAPSRHPRKGEPRLFSTRTQNLVPLTCSPRGTQRRCRVPSSQTSASSDPIHDSAPPKS